MSPDVVPGRSEIVRCYYISQVSYALSNRVGTDGARINCESEGEYTM